LERIPDAAFSGLTQSLARYHAAYRANAARLPASSEECAQGATRFGLDKNSQLPKLIIK